jgi:DNA polymerase III delta subunit
MPSRRSPTRSSPAPSRAGSGPPAPPGPGRVRAAPPARSLPSGVLSLLPALDRGCFPGSLYLEGPDEALKAEVLAVLRTAWAAGQGGIQVFRAAEAGPEQVLAAYQTVSLFTPRELVVVLEVEDWGRSERRVAAVADGLRAGGGASCLALVESAAETPRKGLEPLRAAAAVRVVCDPAGPGELKALAARRLRSARVAAEPAVVDLLLQASQGETATFFNELDKLCAWAGADGTVTAADCRALLRPVVGADLADYLSAVTQAQGAVASLRLARLLATGVGEGSVIFALSNLLGGALGGWARYRTLSEEVRRRWSPRRIAEGLDLLYRVERAWKTGRAGADTLLEHATQALCAAPPPAGP